MRLSAVFLLLATAAFQNAVNAAPLASRQTGDLGCKADDDEGTNLTAARAATAESSNPGGLVCVYSGAGTCRYFPDGTFSQGASDCPQALVAGGDTGGGNGGGGGDPPPPSPPPPSPAPPVVTTPPAAPPPPPPVPTSSAPPVVVSTTPAPAPPAPSTAPRPSSSVVPPPATTSANPNNTADGAAGGANAASPAAQRPTAVAVTALLGLVAFLAL